MAGATYHFLSFVRAGFAAAITQPDTLGAGQQPALATAPVGVLVSGIPKPVSHNAVVRGPGDVIGISASQVVRTDPVDGAVGVEPNYFAQIEFDRPDLPWLFTPAAAAGERLRPWIVLVVVDLDGPNACVLSDGSPLPHLDVPAAAANQLPDLSASHLWAHAQVVTPNGQTVPAAIAGDPRLSISRLMCPRHLEPFRWYLAAVVPAFKVGLLAGLGQGVSLEDETRLDPAWQPGGEAVLPVYYSFRFRTGEEADFESLARKITGRPLPPGVGTRTLDVSRPGAGLPALSPPTDVHDTQSIVWLDGALRPLDSDALPKRDAGAEQTFRANLTVLLDRPAILLRGGDVDPVVAPPIYGDKHALVVELGTGTAPPWIEELNLDARTRVAAGLGTQVVQARQDDLVARAWRQLGDVLAANRLLRAAQLSRSGSLRVHGRLSTLDAATLVSLSAPMHARVVGATGAAVTMAKAVQDSRLPDVAVQPAFRRMTRPRAIAARTAMVSALAETVVARFATESFAAPIGGPDGVSSMRSATEVIGSAQASAVLAVIGDTQPDHSNRLDVVVNTMNVNLTGLPVGDEIRAGTLREDVGAVSLVSSLGAVPATAVAAVLGAAMTTPAPSPQPPPAGPTPGGIHARISPMTIGPHLPAGLARPVGLEASVPPGSRLAAAFGRAVFRPPGVERPVGAGVVLRGGSVVIATDTVHQVATGAANVSRIDDAGWAGLQQAAAVPAVVANADSVTDPGSRLDAIRRDPAALSALAQVADGRVDATSALDTAVAQVATASVAASLQSLASGTFEVPLPHIAPGGASPADANAAREIVAAAAAAFDRIVTNADTPSRPAAAVFDLAAARDGLLTKINPETTIAARVRARLDVVAIVRIAPRDDLDPVMACPKFLDPMWQAVRDLGRGWLLPGLELVPPDTATLVRTNPPFVAAHMVGVNHEFMRELLWREYPTDQRGTAFTRFWGRTGDPADDIGPVHQFSGQLTINLKGNGDEAVLLLRSEILRRYPGSIIYLCRATQHGGDLALDDGTIELPVFRGDLPPDVTFIGFHVSPDKLRAGGDPWWFVIAQPPSEPRFGLDEPSDNTLAVPQSSDDLAWSHLSEDGRPVPFAPAEMPPRLRATLIDGVIWGASAAIQAHLTYQHPVRVAIRAADLLPPASGGP
jgi:hypothetical protein